MRSLIPFATAGAVVAATAAVVVSTAPSAQALPAQTAYALRGAELLSFNPAKPAEVTTTAITGVVTGETLVGIDVRPQNGQLYSLGVNATSDTATLYHLSEQTGLAAPVGTAGAIAFTTDGSAKVELPDPATGGYGFDFNPSVDRLRVTGGSLNFRVDPNTGNPVDGNNVGATTPAVTGTNPDGAVNGLTTSVDGSAYTNNKPNNGNVTTLYTLDSTSDSLYLQAPPNAGTQTAKLPITVNNTAVDFSAVGGFDIDATTDTTANDTAVASGIGYAALTVGGISGLFAIDLKTGNSLPLGLIGSGAPVQGLALQRGLDDNGLPVVGLDKAGTSLVRFGTKTPGTPTPAAVTGITLGETLAAIAWRPQTGQLFGLGVNPTLDTGTLYRVDPQSGALTVIGTASSVAFVSGGLPSLPTDLPDPATVAYGLDFNPTVDRVRVVAGGLNFRVNPDTGAPVDGDNGTTTPATGTNPDGATKIGSTVTALAATTYTNAWGRTLPATPAEAGPTTQYTLDAGTNQLLIQNPPNAGTQTLGKPVATNGTTLDFTAVAGLDVPGTVAVTTSGTRAVGDAFAILTVGGVTSLYTIDLTSGDAAVVGATGDLRSIAVGEAQADRPVVTPPPAPPKPAATLKKVGSLKQVRRTVDTGRVLVCPAGFAKPTCTGSITVRAGAQGRGVQLGKAKISVAKGKQVRVKVTLTEAAAKRIRARGKLPAKVIIVVPTGPQGSARTFKLGITLRKGKL